MDDTFSVCCYYDDNTARYAERDVKVEVAVEAFVYNTTNILAWLGRTQRVVVTDLNNFVSLEWRFGTGITRKAVTKGASHAAESISRT